MTVAGRIRKMASHSTVEVVMADGRTFVVHAPEHVGGSPSGDRVVLPFSDGGMVVVEAGEIAEVRPTVPDPDVESLRRGEQVPVWLMARIREQPELFVKAGRMRPEDLARVLGLLEHPGE
jgi:hypothetical protein